MFTSAIDLIALVSALVAVGAAVAGAFIARRGTDSDLKGDVSELANLVDRLAKESRREKMRGVRAGTKSTAENPEGFPIPPGAEGLAPHEEPSVASKDELRRRVFAARRIK